MKNSTLAIKAKDLLKGKLANFITTYQRAVILTMLPSEEGEYFVNKILKLNETIDAMPEPYQTDGMGEDAIVHLHYFLGSGHWYIIEKDSSEEQHQAFGLADLGYGGELGYISIQELIENEAELDMYWNPKTLKKVKASL